MNVSLLLKRAQDREKFRARFTSGWTAAAVKENFSAWIGSRLSGAFFDGHPWSSTLSAQDIKMFGNAQRLKISLDSLKQISVFMVRSSGQEYSLKVPARAVDGEVNGSELLWAEESSVVWSILNVLAVGDRIRVVWIPNGCSNGFITEAGLSTDVIKLEVQRRDKLLRFVLHQNTLPTNSSIRSIQNNSWIIAKG